VVFSTGVYVVTGIVVFALAVGVFLVLKARHPNARNERFLWSEAQRIAAVGLAVVVLGGLVFITLRYS
jgi:multisubunit Na+/H+ antiporter MnhB subunit